MPKNEAAEPDCIHFICNIECFIVDQSTYAAFKRDVISRNHFYINFASSTCEGYHSSQRTTQLIP